MEMISIRLKNVLDETVSTLQHALVEGGQILDVALVANKVVVLGESKKCQVCCAFDLEKAYNHMNWRFLESIMLQIGFGKKWRTWIYFCLSFEL